MKRLTLVAGLILWAAMHGQAADLVLGENGKSDYQIVVPDTNAAPEIGRWLDQAALLIQAAFKSNGCDLTVVKEAGKDPAKPAIYLGNTAFARAHDVDVTGFRDWTYVHKVVGKDLIVAGNDWPDTYVSPRTGRMYLLGTIKGATDFLRQYAGVRFLWPGFKPDLKPVDGNGEVTSPDPNAIEFLKTPRIAVPADLNLKKVPAVLTNFDYFRQTFYDIALNTFPLLGGPMDGHSYPDAIPAEKYRDTHPEYFALINGKRCCFTPSGNPEWMHKPWVEQYCISNPDVQELIYRRALERLDRGNDDTSVGQPDGFQKCQCEECRKLYGTGDDWDEKLWIFHRKIAERLQKERPGKRIHLMVYVNTSKPPKTFSKLPTNAVLRICGNNSEQELAIWKPVEVPGGFAAYLHNWGEYHIAGRYAPVRTPGYVEKQVQKLYAHHVRMVDRDGSIGHCWGLEGPVYYTYGRMYDDPEHNNARDLVDEFCSAAFVGRACGPMKTFFERLYKQIAVYSDVLGTHEPGWGASRAHENYNFNMIGYLYTPEFLAAAESDLSQAEKLADSQRVKTRLSLIRVEFNYLKGLASIVHLYRAYQIRPTQASRDALLDAIDQWHAGIDPLFGQKGEKGLSGYLTRPIPGWPGMYPFNGHPRGLVALESNGYQSMFKDTCLNWDTAAMRSAPLPGETRKLSVKRVAAPPAPRAPEWDTAPAAGLVDMASGIPRTAARTTVKALYDSANLYLRIEAGDVVEPAGKFTPVGRDGTVDGQESLDLSLAPAGDRNQFYHFVVGPLAGSVYDAAHGFITDGIDPRYGKDDPTWNGNWTYTCDFDRTASRWTAFLTIPFKTLGVSQPAAGTVWQANLGRRNFPGRESVKHLVWSRNPECRTFSDPRAFGDLVFGE